MAISPSAIEKFNLCKRLYFWAYIMGEWDNDPPGPATTAGKKAHAQLETGVVPETWTADIFYNAMEGKYKFTTVHPGPGWRLVPFDFDIGRLAANMAEHIPTGDVLVGHEVNFKKQVEGIEFSGIIDRLSDQFITDYKTTGSDLKWAKTDRKLLNDVQRLLYSAAFPDVPNSRWITGTWLDYSVQVGERQNVSSDREKFKLHVLEPAQEMLALHKGLDPLSFPLPSKPDKYTGMCKECTNSFGKPCPRIDRCFPKVRKKLSLSPLLANKASKEVLPTGEAALNELTRMAQEDGMYTSVDKAESRLPLTLPVREPVSSSDLLHDRIHPASGKLLSASSIFGLTGQRYDMPNDVPWPGDVKKESVKYLIENLYIDCFPISKFEGELEYSHQYIFEAGQEVASDMGVASAMLVDFGKGPHLVAAQLIATLMDRSEPIKHLFLETRSAEGRACMQELTARSRFVTKGCY